MSQHMEALARANGVRYRAARVKREIAVLSRRDGARRVAGALRDPDIAAGSIKVEDLIASIHLVGPVKARRLLEDCGIEAGHGKRVRDLTARQRELVAEAVVWMGDPPEPPPERWPGSRAVQKERHRRLMEMADEGADPSAIAEQLGYAGASSVRRVMSTLASRRTA